jgi:hypothetical protein
MRRKVEDEERFFQGLESGTAGFSKDWKRSRDFFPSLGTGTAFGPNWHEVSQ